MRASGLPLTTREDDGRQSPRLRQYSPRQAKRGSLDVPAPRSAHGGEAPDETTPSLDGACGLVARIEEGPKARRRDAGS